MKNIKTYELYTESLRDKIKGKSSDEVMKKLLDSKLSPIDLLYMSVKHNIKEGVLLALEKGIIEYDEDGDIVDEVSLMYYADQALIWASKNNYVDIIKKLIDNGVYIKSNDNKALRTAAYEGQYDSVKILLENGADVHASNDDSIKYAAMNGHHRLVKLLLDYHANPNVALNGAIKYGHHNIVRLLKRYIHIRNKR